MACTFCRARKIKCDKGNPTCGSCNRYKYRYVYEATRKVGASRPRKKGYISVLQKRLGMKPIQLHMIFDPR